MAHADGGLLFVLSTTSTLHFSIRLPPYKVSVEWCMVAAPPPPITRTFQCISLGPSLDPENFTKEQ
jgi:hypothetical protein